MVDTDTDTEKAKAKATFSSGATSSSEKPRYDLIPTVALRRLAERFGYGARKHGDHNYKQGFRDPAFIRDRINHLIEHAVKYASGDRGTDHLGAVMCNAAMLAELEQIAQEPEPQRGEWSPARDAEDEVERDRVAGTNRMCGAQKPDSSFGYICTRSRGHRGDHVGLLSNGAVCARWKREDARG